MKFQQKSLNTLVKELKIMQSVGVLKVHYKNKNINGVVIVDKQCKAMFLNKYQQPPPTNLPGAESELNMKNKKQ